MSTALAIASRPREPDAAQLEALLDEEFLAGIGWDPQRQIMLIAPEHRTLGYAVCRVTECGVVAQRAGGLCATCTNRWKASGEALEEFLLRPRRGRTIGEPPCVVDECQRPALSTRKSLCRAHEWQRAKTLLGLPLEQFLRRSDVVGLAGFGSCAVPACPRPRDRSVSTLCRAHDGKWNQHRRRDPNLKLDDWMVDQPAVVERGLISLRGLPPLARAELLFGVQQRCASGTRTVLPLLRGFTYRVRDRRVNSLADLGDNWSCHTLRGIWRSIVGHVELALATPETERTKDVWNAAVFGGTGLIDFTGIHQPWLREATKRVIFEDFPRRRGHRSAHVLRRRVIDVVHLSESLRLQRVDAGQHPGLLGRTDIVAFLNRLGHLNATGRISHYQHVKIARRAAALLRDVRAVGLTRPGEPAAGLGDDFVLRPGDIPAETVQESPGRAIPDEIFTQLIAELPVLETSSFPEARVAVQLLMDTGRRPGEICVLPLDCLDRDPDGKYLLVYDDAKTHRRGRRLPIKDSTGELILTQQHAVRARFPGTDPARLVLLPAPLRNPHGTRTMPMHTLGEVHRRWVDALPDLLHADGAIFPKAAIVPYAWRHSYAQRHADAGVSPDVLRDLMGHRSMDTTQIYYRITEKRTRAAVERITAHQFDRHGTPLWRHAEQLLDHEHVRRNLGQVAVPYGLCTEPTNVQAGGGACPLRFRCVGCHHFRTDPSYLPDLRAYLQDLLRDRERILAATDLDGWARTDAAPSEDEIKKIRHLVRRVEEHLDELTDDDRTQILEATAMLRRTRPAVALGMPTVRTSA
ncbi:tyrosine-type recombinase/integrase [Actinoplanes sp. G11-F43]|uniref:tyrosine-type recombinase/integrase n=1 Tax=Actinoplanes sp. G11-F43 TaxID=3424130 RepID=UPI003D32DDBA